MIKRHPMPEKIISLKHTELQKRLIWLVKRQFQTRYERITNNTLDTKTALNELTESFSLERIAVIAAVSLRDKDWDGRISSENKAWAKAFPFPKDIDDWGIDRNIVYAISETHPGLLDLFANAVRKELELIKTIPLKKPSLVEKLNRPLPQKTDKGSNSKEQEL